jgi:hypothetical protein
MSLRSSAAAIGLVKALAVERDTIIRSGEPGDYSMRAAIRYATGLRSYLREPLSPEDCRSRIRAQLEGRDRSFLLIAERAIYANPRSPYRELLDHAGVELGDLAALVREDGVEGTLGRLYDAGVKVTIDEFKGRVPIRRGDLDLATRHRDFENPLLLRHYEARTGGSRSAGNRIRIDFDLLTHEAAQHRVFLDAFGLGGSPYGNWHPVPPGHAGMKAHLRHAKLGLRAERWFSQNRHSWRPAELKYRFFTGYAVYGSRMFGRPLPRPEHVPLDRASTVASWLAEKTADGAPAVIETTWSSAVRACIAAGEAGLDISGTLFRVGGEPATDAKAEAIAATGSRHACHYSLGEVGRAGMACADRVAMDEVHLLTDKLAAISRPRQVGAARIEALHLTTLLPSCPHVLLNVDVGDAATIERRRCACPFGELGLTTHLREIGGYEKLTTEGMNFLGTELVTIVDRVLPERFGGAPTHYQLAEGEDGALPRIDIVISPGVGEVDEQEAVSAVLAALASVGEPQRMMAETWRDGGTLRVVRREPYATRGAKVLPLHVARTARSGGRSGA